MRVAVVGGGVVGLSTTVALAGRGVDVTCYEPDTPMSSRSAGGTRIFRLAHVYPGMVSLAAESRRLFAEWDSALIDDVGTVVSGEGVTAWAAAMAEAGAEHAVVEAGSALLRLPAHRFAGQALVDPAGGVIRVDRVRAFLVAAAGGRLRRARVDHIEETDGRVRVRSGPETEAYDAAVICAGAGTPSLCADAPAALEHHVRFSFPLRPEAAPPLQCWITVPAGGPSTYQHMSAPGTWAVGAHVDHAAVAWEVGPQEAERASREAVTAYVARELPAVEPRVVGRLYCTHHPDLGDGFRFVRRGRVLAVYGENLFKFAPLLGLMLAVACIDGSTPTDAGPHQT